MAQYLVAAAVESTRVYVEVRKQQNASIAGVAHIEAQSDGLKFVYVKQGHEGAEGTFATPVKLDVEVMRQLVAMADKVQTPLSPIP